MKVTARSSQRSGAARHRVGAGGQPPPPPAAAHRSRVRVNKCVVERGSAARRTLFAGLLVAGALTGAETHSAGLCARVPRNRPQVESLFLLAPLLSLLAQPGQV